MGDKAMGAVTLFNSLIYLAWMLALNESRHEYEVLRPSAELIECVYNRSIQQMNDRFGRYKKLENINEVDNVSMLTHFFLFNTFRISPHVCCID